MVRVCRPTDLTDPVLVVTVEPDPVTLVHVPGPHVALGGLHRRQERRVLTDLGEVAQPRRRDRSAGRVEGDGGLGLRGGGELAAGGYACGDAGLGHGGSALSSRRAA